MGRYKDILPSSQQGWIHELARAEVHPDAERLLQLGHAFDPQQVVEESTIDFLTALKATLTEYIQIFNGFSENGSRFQDVKIYVVAQSAADFMMYRNYIKLVFSSTAHGVIQIAFAHHLRGTMGVDGKMVNGEVPPNSQTSASGMTQELLAQIGPFRDVQWTFQGEKVSPEQIAKFYFAEFVRATRDGRKSKAGNEALLQQIKALLNEKGLNL